MRLRSIVFPLLWTVLSVQASAQVRLVVPSAEASGASAGAVAAAAAAPLAAPAPILALTHELTLGAPAPALSAGSAFLDDQAAQRWYLDNRPERFPALAQKALAMRDWEEVLTSFEDPRTLREALLSRSETSMGASPSALLALVDRTPALAAKRRLFEEAVLEWSVLGPQTRQALADLGAGEERWSQTSLPDRYEVLRRAYQGLAAEMITTTPGDPEYAAQYERAFQRIGPVMTNGEILEHLGAVARARRLADGLQRARRTAEVSGDATASALLERARNTPDIDEAEAALGALEKRFGFAAPPAAPTYDLSPEETRALVQRLGAAILRSLKGTPLGEKIRAAIPATGLNLTIGAAHSALSLAHYESRSRTVVLGAQPLADLMASLDRTPRDLLTDDDALADAATLYSHLFVHEATHHLQHLRADFLPEKLQPLTYSWASEMEANNSQALFLKQKRAADPAFAAREERLRRDPGMLGAAMTQPERMASERSQMSLWLTSSYARVPTLARAGARLIAAGAAADRAAAESVKVIDAELARRRRLSRDQRLILEKDGRSADAAATEGVRKVATSELRRLRADLSSQARSMIAAVQILMNGYGDALRALAP